VIAEELGFAGGARHRLFLCIVARALRHRETATLHQRHFAALAAQGIGVWIGFQALINMGVNVGCSDQGADAAADLSTAARAWS
jgi:cell division protein FtsW